MKAATAIVTDITGCLRHQAGRGFPVPRPPVPPPASPNESLHLLLFPYTPSSPPSALRTWPGGVTLPPVARVVVEVMLKPEIHDPQGEAIASACHRLGFGQVVGVRQGKRFEVELSEPADKTAMAWVAELAGELLANPVIEEFSVHPA